MHGGPTLDAFPAYFPLDGRFIAVVGATPAAEAKARMLAGSPARLRRVNGAESFLPSSYADVLLAFIGGDDAFCQTASGIARKAGALVHVMDHPKLSDFMVPAIVDRGEVVAAVGTAGGSSLVGAMLSPAIEAGLPAGAGRLAALMQKHTALIQRTLPDTEIRRRFLRDQAAGPAGQAALAGDMKAAGELFASALRAGGAPTGRVRFVAGRGPADLLTLRAVQTLASADILVAGEDANPDILAMTRNDVRKLDPATADADQLVGLARDGFHVAVLLTRAPDPLLLKALITAKVEIDVLLAAPKG